MHDASLQAFGLAAMFHHKQVYQSNLIAIERINPVMTYDIWIGEYLQDPID
jgi:hypothetical protein